MIDANLQITRQIAHRAVEDTHHLDTSRGEGQGAPRRSAAGFHVRRLPGHHQSAAAPAGRQLHLPRAHRRQDQAGHAHPRRHRLRRAYGIHVVLRGGPCSRRSSARMSAGPRSRSSPAGTTTRRKRKRRPRPWPPTRPPSWRRPILPRRWRSRPGLRPPAAYATFTKARGGQTADGPWFRGLEELRQAQLVHPRGDGEGRLRAGSRSWLRRNEVWNGSAASRLAT